MEAIIPPVDKELIKAELRQCLMVRPTNKADNEVYDLTAHEAPNIMREIARLREESYRAAGGSTGASLDMDEMDTMEKPYRQLIVWDPENEAIVAGYRYICCQDCQFTEEGQPKLSSSHLFHYSPYFIKHYLPRTIELGRAFVSLNYQGREMGKKSLFALDNIWDGIGAVLANHPETKYLMGKVTIHPTYDPTARNLIYAYLQRFCADKRGLFRPYNPIEISLEGQELADKVFTGENATINWHLLQKAVRNLGTVVPPMFSAYLNVTGHLRSFGTATNDELSNAYETGILVTVKDIYVEKWARYVDVYLEYLSSILPLKKRKLLRKKNK